MQIGRQEIDFMKHDMPIVDKDYEFVMKLHQFSKKDLQAISMLNISFKSFERFPKRRFTGLFLQH